MAKFSKTRHFIPVIIIPSKVDYIIRKPVQGNVEVEWSIEQKCLVS